MKEEPVMSSSNVNADKIDLKFRKTSYELSHIHSGEGDLTNVNQKSQIQVRLSEISSDSSSNNTKPHFPFV